MKSFKPEWSLAVGAALISTPVALWAQEAKIEEIVVTGSNIRGTQTDGALPVDVVSREDLDKLGSPSIIEMVRNLGVTSGNLGESNQFTPGAVGNEGVNTINLRGLGSARTLVLINGRRHVGTETLGVDISALPISAVGRMEVLKDGAAAIYGSDAIGGVVNFITRNDVRGFEIGGNYTAVDGGGDREINGIFGTGGERWNWTVAAEYLEREELPLTKRDWGVLPFSANSAGGWSSTGNPADIFFVDGNRTQGDPECQNMGGWRDSLNSCGLQFSQFFNLVEKTRDQKYYTEFNFDITPDTKLHLEGLYSYVNLPEWKHSPSTPPNSFRGLDRVVPASHPGLVAMRADYPSLFQTGPAFVMDRPLGVTGDDGEGRADPRQTKTYRLAASLDGALFQDRLNYDASASWSKRERYAGTDGAYIERMGYALNGFGGPNCDRSVIGGNGTPGVGTPVSTPGVGNCMYYNPFSNAIQRSAVNGYVNPNYDPALANSPELFDWLITQTGNTTTNELFVLDATVNGQTGVQLGGGAMGFAVGAQLRREKFDFDVPDVSDATLNPCPWGENEALAGYLFGFNSNCAAPTGVLASSAARVDTSSQRSIYGVYGELALPFTDAFNMQLAVRFEDYGGKVGSTIDPKAAFSWKFAEGFTLRGSAGTTFRGPPQSILSGSSTGLQFVAAQNTYVPVEFNGNPNLKPEKAVTSNLGLIYQNGGFYGSIDYWRFDFEDPFQQESSTQITNAYFARGCQNGGAGAATAECEALRSHIFPLGTNSAGLNRIEINNINGSDITTSGIDLLAQYDFDDVFGGSLGIGLQGGYTIEYQSDDFLDINGVVLAKGGEFAGYLNDAEPFTPMPKTRGDVFFRYDHGIHNAQVIFRYVSSYEDRTPAVSTIRDLSEIDDQLTADVHYTVRLLDNSTSLSLSVINVTDKDPPLAGTGLNYDAFTHNPLGRIFKVGLKYSFSP